MIMNDHYQLYKSAQKISHSERDIEIFYNRTKVLNNSEHCVHKSIKIIVYFLNYDLLI